MWHFANGARMSTGATVSGRPKVACQLVEHAATQSTNAADAATARRVR
jgi:hypothetical protein